MPYYTRLGDIPSKRHVRFHRPDGGFYSEEVFGTEGFVGPTSTLYHIHPPTQVMGWKSVYSTKVEYVETDVMRMRHVKTAPRPAHACGGCFSPSGGVGSSSLDSDWEGVSSSTTSHRNLSEPASC